MKLAVIDLGTNTCNLLIAKVNSSEFKILHQSKQLVKLGDGKIKSNEISNEATERTIQSFKNHKQIIDRFEVDKVKCIATSAVRSAGNKISFLEKLGEQTGWVVKVVSGEKEAELIFNGVLLAIKNFQESSVILDIGGGSNELILANETKMLWKESRPTGMARIINHFEISNPIRPDEIKKIKDYYQKEHSPAFQKCKSNNVKTLIGCSGAFDTVADIIDEVNPGEKQRTLQEIAMEQFYSVYEKILFSTQKERLEMKGMDRVRVDLIVPAIILIEKLISSIDIEKIIQTDFALREGVLYEIMNPVVVQTK